MLLRLRWRKLAFGRFGKAFMLILLLWTVYDIFSVHRSCAREAAKDLPALDQKIFIASIHWTDEIMLRSHWAAALMELAKAIGPSNVFVSIYESGSFDNTKDMLQTLNADLELAGIPHKVVLDDTTHKDEAERPPADTGWIQMPSTQSYRENWTGSFSLEKGTWVPRRIPYLARLRNLAMEPLYELQQEGEMFSKVLWLNDVVFNTEDVRRLLGTRDGEYAAVCALDFKRPPKFYDTFALRDDEGFEPLMETWPYFRSQTSREALKRGQAVPVTSCWNGMLAIDAAPFYNLDQPLSFRGVADDLANFHLEGSECCLIHADNPLSSSKGVWLNPNVRVTYSGQAYEEVNSGAGVSWPSTSAIALGLWKNRVLRWINSLAIRGQAFSSKLGVWMSQDPAKHQEPGTFCLIDEMQILLWNGWGHA